MQLSVLSSRFSQSVATERALAALSAQWRGRIIWVLTHPLHFLYAIFEYAISYLVQAISSAARWTYLVLNDYTVPHVDLPGGYKNAGNTCYLSSLIQCLSGIDKFSQSLESLDDTQIVRYTAETDEKFELRKVIIKKWKELVYLSKTQKSVQASEINNFRILLNQYKPGITVDEQEDPSEICSTLYEITQHRPIYYLFTYLHEIVQDRNTLAIPSLPAEEKVLQHTCILQATIPDHYEIGSRPQQLQDLCLQECEKRETAASDYDASGKLKRLPKGTLSLQTIQIPLIERPVATQDGIFATPPFLTIKLKRFNISGMKVFTPITAPEYFELHADEHPTIRFRYRLRSLIVHEGNSIEEGHFISYVKKKIDRQPQWIRCNDGKVGLCVDKERVENQVTNEGYLFFYEHEETIDTSTIDRSLRDS